MNSLSWCTLPAREYRLQYSFLSFAVTNHHSQKLFLFTFFIIQHTTLVPVPSFLSVDLWVNSGVSIKVLTYYITETVNTNYFTQISQFLYSIVNTPIFTSLSCYWRIHCLPSWLTDQLTSEPNTNQRTDWLMIVRSGDRSTSCSWPADWLTNWLIYRPTP